MKSWNVDEVELRADIATRIQSLHARIDHVAHLSVIARQERIAMELQSIRGAVCDLFEFVYPWQGRIKEGPHPKKR